MPGYAFVLEALLLFAKLKVNSSYPYFMVIDLKLLDSLKISNIIQLFSGLHGMLDIEKFIMFLAKYT